MHDATFNATFRNLYTKFKFGKPKHHYYVRNRRSSTMILDEYDRYIIEHLIPGTTIAYDSVGYYLDGAIDNLVVIDRYDFIKKWYPKVVIDPIAAKLPATYNSAEEEDSVRPYYGTADNFIVINTIRARWEPIDYVTKYWQYQSRFLKPGCQVFFSFRSHGVKYNKLKYNFEHILNPWLDEMSTHGFKLIRKQYDKIQIDETMTVLEHLPEVKDTINGNVKVHWEYRP